MADDYADPFQQQQPVQQPGANGGGLNIRSGYSGGLGHGAGGYGSGGTGGMAGGGMSRGGMSWGGGQQPGGGYGNPWGAMGRGYGQGGGAMGGAIYNPSGGYPFGGGGYGNPWGGGVPVEGGAVNGMGLNRAPTDVWGQPQPMPSSGQLPQPPLPSGAPNIWGAAGQPSPGGGGGYGNPWPPQQPPLGMPRQQMQPPFSGGSMWNSRARMY